MKKPTHPSKNDACKINPPKTLIPIMEAFQVKSDKEIKALVIKTTQNFLKEKLRKEELRSVVSLIKDIKPNNTLEALYASQFVVFYLLGMRKLTAVYPDDQKVGLKLLSFSNKALQQLYKKR
ncbi:MAG: hypothetical protein K1060chlam3_00257 [Candidatus Anoxychlamydiales bacterium]|nr:hypothetical protein [Candidatus Anoxychlamydiales bacterium]